MSASNVHSVPPNLFLVCDYQKTVPQLITAPARVGRLAVAERRRCLSDFAVRMVDADEMTGGYGSTLRCLMKIVGTNVPGHNLGLPHTPDRWDVEETPVTSASFRCIMQPLLLVGQSFDHSTLQQHGP
jgi:hypothetical protein